MLASQTLQGGHANGKVYPLREAFQKGKAQDRSGPAADLGRVEPRHPEARKQQGLQQKEDAGLEEGTSRPASFVLHYIYNTKVLHIFQKSI